MKKIILKMGTIMFIILGLTACGKKMNRFNQYQMFPK